MRERLRKNDLLVLEEDEQYAFMRRKSRERGESRLRLLLYAFMRRKSRERGESRLRLLRFLLLLLLYDGNALLRVRMCF
jgi:hypothetical protein